MTTVKAQACAAAIIGAGYNVQVKQRGDDDWVVKAYAANIGQTVPLFAITSGQIVGLETAQTVTGHTAEVEFT